MKFSTNNLLSVLAITLFVLAVMAPSASAFRFKRSPVTTVFDRMWDHMDHEFRRHKEVMNRARTAATTWNPDYDIIEQKDETLLFLQIPGVEEEDVDVSLSNDILTIRGRTNYCANYGLNEEEVQEEVIEADILVTEEVEGEEGEATTTTGSEVAEPATPACPLRGLERSFSTSFSLSNAAVGKHVWAEHHNGILTIHIPNVPAETHEVPVLRGGKVNRVPQVSN